MKKNAFKNQCLGNARIYLHGVGLGLTFASFESLEPPVISVSVAGTSTILIPSTARSATTGSAGFFERAALWARRGGCCCAGY